MSNLRTHMRAEFDAWRANLPGGTGLPDFPDLFDANGLPQRWKIRAHAPMTQRGPTNVTVGLVSNLHGAWALVIHSADPVGDHRNTLVNEYAASLTDLYVKTCEFAESPMSGTREWGRLVHETTRAFILDCYDPADPAEAAEQVLVALGGHPTLTPATATHPKDPS